MAKRIPNPRPTVIDAFRFRIDYLEERFGGNPRWDVIDTQTGKSIGEFSTYRDAIQAAWYFENHPDEIKEDNQT